MNRRSLLQALGVSLLALLGSCLGRTDATGEYPTLLTLARGGSETSEAASGTGENRNDGGGENGDPSDGDADGGGLGEDGGSDDGETDDGGAGDSDETPPDDIGFDVDGLLAGLESDGIENGSASVAGGTLSVSFDSTAADAREAQRELRTVLEVVDDAITDPDAFGSAVDGIVVRFRRPDGSKARPVPVNPEWALAYRAGDISMETYLERVRGKKR